MKKTFFVFLLVFFASCLFCRLPITDRQSPSDPWLARSLACFTSEEAAKLLPNLEKMKSDEKYLYLGIVYHNLAANGHGEYIPKALDYCRQAIEKKPTPLALGYLGSALTLQAESDFRRNDMQAAVQNLQEGVRQLDEGVAQSPKNIPLRILRIENSLALSQGSPLNRDDKINEDMAFLKSAYDALPPELRSFFHLKEAQLHVKNKEIDLAVQSFESAIQAAPASSHAMDAKKELAKLEK